MAYPDPRFTSTSVDQLERIYSCRHDAASVLVAMAPLTSIISDCVAGFTHAPRQILSFLKSK